MKLQKIDFHEAISVKCKGKVAMGSVASRKYKPWSGLGKGELEKKTKTYE